MKTYTIIIAIIFAGMFTSCKKSTLSPDRCDKHITATEDDTDDINNTARRSDGRQVRIGDEERPNRHERSTNVRRARDNDRRDHGRLTDRRHRVGDQDRRQRNIRSTDRTKDVRPVRR